MIKVPENCGLCLSNKQFGDKFICGMPTSKEKEILDISSFEVNLDSRPNWCPINKIIDNINNLSEENKILFDKIYDGFLAMFELINNHLIF